MLDNAVSKCETAAMNLKEFIDSKRGNAVFLATALDVPASYISQLASGDRKPSPELCVRIEVATESVVTRQDMRTDWLSIWPELAKTA
jgi:DNA-binding transcriptional regulator YdaS (Cro superfamily)